MGLKERLFHWLRPPAFENPEEAQRARILSRILYIVPITFIFFAWERIRVGDYAEVWVLLASQFVIATAFIWLRLRRLNVAVLSMGLPLLVHATLVATLGEGIHDIVIMAYPGLVLIMSLMLDRRDFLIYCGLVILSLAWVVFGETAGFYKPTPCPPVMWTDFLVASTILFLSSLAAMLLSEGMKKNLRLARQEIERREALTARLETHLHEKELLLKEVHHRVKNNLTVINSLLSLQEKHIENRDQAIKAFSDVRSRIFSMALVHERLYQSSDFSKVSMCSYGEYITKHLMHLFGGHGRITLNLKIDDIALGLDQAIPCGMFISEIMTNAFKHAFVGRERGEITVQMAMEEGDLCDLSIADDGNGLPARVDPEKPDSMGMKLIALLAEQLDGQMDMQTGEGSVFHLRFPIQKNKRRSTRLPSD